MDVKPFARVQVIGHGPCEPEVLFDFKDPSFPYNWDIHGKTLKLYSEETVKDLLAKIEELEKKQ